MATRNVPLHCSICPKKPDFSDLSHLLTHVASKGHLSHYYKVKVQSSNHADARERIDAYDQWYSDWNIEGLMSDRLAIKDRKRKRAATSAPATRPAKKAMLPKSPKTPPVDPRLSFTLDRQRALEELKSEVNDPGPLGPPPIFFHRKVVRPRLHLWSTHRPASIDAIPLEFSSPPVPIKFPIFPGFPQPAPLAPMVRSKKQVVVLEDDAEPISEMTRLKGIFWPGMDIFDAATTPMRRKRNQKKEISVVDRLEKNAAGVEANEMIFTPGGTLAKQRPITGQVDFDSSPYKLSQLFSSPLKQKPPPRTALTTKDPNRPGRTTSRPANSRQSQGSTSITATSNKRTVPATKPSKKRKKEFTVLDERHDPEEPADGLNAGLATGLTVLASEFNPEPIRHTLPAASAFSLEGPLAALYRPAYQHNYLADAFESYHQPMFDLPFQPFYAQMGYDIPGFFSNPPQQSEQQTVDLTELQIKRAIAEEPFLGSPSAG